MRTSCRRRRHQHHRHRPRHHQTPEFARIVESALAGVTTRWPPGHPHRYVGVGGMNAVGKTLAAGLDVRLNTKVLAVRRAPDGASWELEVEGQPRMTAARLLLSAPVPQSLALLAAGGVALPAAEDAALRGIAYNPCLALLLALSGPSAVPSGGVAAVDSPLRWVADNATKWDGPALPARAGALTVHFTPAFSEAHYGSPEPEVFAAALPALRQFLGDATVTNRVLHRWRFCEPVAPFPERCIWLQHLALGFCGDAFGGPRVEGAALSGIALAAASAAAAQPSL